MWQQFNTQIANKKNIIEKSTILIKKQKKNPEFIRLTTRENSNRSIKI